jgi:hypothetical protein
MRLFWLCDIKRGNILRRRSASARCPMLVKGCFCNCSGVRGSEQDVSTTDTSKDPEQVVYQ